MRLIGLAVFLVFSVVAAPLATGEEQPRKVFRIGILSNVPISDLHGGRVWVAFIDGLRDLGYVEGRNITIEHRSSEGNYDRLPELAAELVRLKVDVIVVPATRNVIVAKQATQTIPIVMAGTADAVGFGLVTSLARPGGNVTGISTLGPEIVGKQLALLKEISPRVSRVAVLGNPANDGYARVLEELTPAAKSLGMSLQILNARRPDDLAPAFAAATREHAGALFVFTDGMFLLHRKRIIDLAAKHRMPTMYGTSEFADYGGLVSYGPSMSDGFRRAATYVDKILKGAKPGDLPIEQPTKFELVINVKTAKALGLTIPPSVLGRADQVIE
jgi:ABC-type uncharacterized transport system substrate-binding protein